MEKYSKFERENLVLCLGCMTVFNEKMDTDCIILLLQNRITGDSRVVIIADDIIMNEYIKKDLHVSEKMTVEISGRTLIFTTESEKFVFVNAYCKLLKNH